MKPVYKRVLLKISGQSMAGDGGFGIDTSKIRETAEQLVEVSEAGVELGIVCGGGNVIRGITAAAEGLDRTAADYMACSRAS